MKRGASYAQKHHVQPIKKFVGGAAPKAPRRSDALHLVHLVLVALLSFIIGVTMTLTVANPEVVRRIQKKEVWNL